MSDTKEENRKQEQNQNVKEEVLFDTECFVVRSIDNNIVIESKGTCDPEKYNKMLALAEKGAKTIYRRRK